MEISFLRDVFDVLMVLVVAFLIARNLMWKRRAQRDGLTGLFNHLSIKKFVRETIRGNGTHPVSVLMIDVDHFKKFNDEHGHTRGDEALQFVAAILNRVLRVAPGRRLPDRAGRWGGEEFCVLLPDTGLETAAKVAERIRREVEVESIKAGFPPITVSIGVANSPEDVPQGDPDILVREADLRLYQAKTKGRNRVVA